MCTVFKKTQNYRPREVIPFYFVGNFPEVSNICWKANSADHKKSRYVHWCDKFMTWMTVLLMKGHVLLDLILTRKEELVEDFGCCLQWPWDGGAQDTERRDEGKQQDSNLGLEESELWPVRAVLARMPWETTLERGEFQERWLVSDIICSSLKNGPFQWAGSLAIATGHVHGWTNCSRFNSCMKKHM